MHYCPVFADAKLTKKETQKSLKTKSKWKRKRTRLHQSTVRVVYYKSTYRGSERHLPRSPRVYYESTKREPKIRGINKCRCDERLQSKTKEFTRLPYTGLVLELEHLKIETRLISVMFASAILPYLLFVCSRIPEFKFIMNRIPPFTYFFYLGRVRH